MQAFAETGGALERHLRVRELFAHPDVKASEKLKTAEIEFGITIDVEGNVYVVKAKGAANISVKLTWDFERTA